MIVSLLIHIKYIGWCILIDHITKFIANAQWIIVCHMNWSLFDFIAFTTGARQKILSRITEMNQNIRKFSTTKAKSYIASKKSK